MARIVALMFFVVGPIYGAFAQVPSSSIGRPEVYFLVQASDNIDDYRKVFLSSCTAGVTLYVSWARLESEEGAYQWSLIDPWLEEARRNGKRVNIGIFGGNFAPDWAKEAAGVVAFRRHLNKSQVEAGKDRVTTAPLMISNALFAKIETLVKSLAVKYGKRPEVGYIAITGPNLTGFTTNLTIPLEEDVEGLFNLGFTVDDYIKAWERTIDLYAAQFTEKQVILGIGPILGDSKPNKRLVDYGIERHRNFGVMLDFLNSKWLPSSRDPKITAILDCLRAAKARAKTGYQMVWWQDESELTGDLASSLEFAQAQGASWVEIWQKDFENFENCCCR